MTGPKQVGDATHVIVTPTGGQQQVTPERAADLKNRFYPTMFKDGVDKPAAAGVADNETVVIATPGETPIEVRPLDDAAIDQLVSGALTAGVSADRRAQTIKTLLLQDRPDAALILLQGVNQQGQLGELLIALSTLDGPGTWTTRLALSSENPGALALVMSYAPGDARAAALSVLAPIAETEAGHRAVRQLLSAASRDQSLEQLVRRLDNMRTGDVATVREILIASMASNGDTVSLLMLGASGEPIPDAQAPKEKLEKKAEETKPETLIKPSAALTPAAVTEVIKASNPEMMVSKVERGLREHPEAAQRALAALATLRSQGMVVVAEGAQAGGVAKEAYWGVISVDEYAAQYKGGQGHDGMTRTRPGQTLEWELAEATRYVDEVLNCTFENGVWRSRTADETVAVLRQRYPRVFGPSNDGRVHFNSDRLNAPPCEIRDNVLISSVETFTPAEFALSVAETDTMLTFHELATAHPEIATYDGERQLTVRTGNDQIRLQIRGDRVYSPDAPDDVRASGADVKAWVTGVARPEPNQPKPVEGTATSAAMQAFTDATRQWSPDLREKLGFAGVDFLLARNEARMVLQEQGGSQHTVTTLSLVDASGRPLSSEQLLANAELALITFLSTNTQPMPPNPEVAWRSILHEANHYARTLGHSGVVAVPRGLDPTLAASGAKPFDPALTYDFYLLDNKGGHSMVTQIKLATQGGTEMFTPSVCIRDVRAYIYERHAQLSPAAVDMTPKSWEQLNGWLQNRTPVPTKASIADKTVIWRDQTGAELRVNLDVPENIKLQVVDDNILRVVNTAGTFRAMSATGPIESRDLFIAFAPGQATPFHYLFGSLQGELVDLGPGLETLIFDSNTTTVDIGGKQLAVRGPGLAQRYQLVSGLTANHSALIYNGESGKVELSHGWQGNGGVAKFLDDDVSDGSVTIHVDYSSRGEGVQVWKIDLDFESGDAGQSYDARCILNTTSTPITAAQDFTDTDAARAELAGLGVEYQPSTRLRSFGDVLADPKIDGQQLLQSLQTVPDADAGRALDTLLAIEATRVSTLEPYYFAIGHLTVVESIVAFNPQSEAQFNEMLRRLSDAHNAFITTYRSVRDGTSAMRNLVRQAAAAELGAGQSRLSMFNHLASQQLAKLQG